MGESDLAATLWKWFQTQNAPFGGEISSNCWTPTKIASAMVTDGSTCFF
jgi:hypothetical protein